MHQIFSHNNLYRSFKFYISEASGISLILLFNSMIRYLNFEIHHQTRNSGTNCDVFFGNGNFKFDIMVLRIMTKLIKRRSNKNKHYIKA